MAVFLLLLLIAIGVFFAVRAMSKQGQVQTPAPAARTPAVPPSTPRVDPLDLGKSQFNAGATAEAAQSLEAAMRSNPNHGEARYYLSLCYVKLKRLEDAKALLLATPDEEMCAALSLVAGQVFYYLGEYDRAEQAFRHADTDAVLSNDGTSVADARIGQAYCLYKAGNLTKAADRYTSFISSKSQPSSGFAKWHEQLEQQFGDSTSYGVERAVQRKQHEDRLPEEKRLDTLAQRLAETKGQYEEITITENNGRRIWTFTDPMFRIELTTHFYPGSEAPIEETENLEISSDGHTVLSRTWDKTRPRERAYFNGFEPGPWIERLEALANS